MISIKLSDAMWKKKVRMADVIRATGISRPTLTWLCNGRSKGINFDTLEKLCRYFQVDVGELIKFENDEVVTWHTVNPKEKQLKNGNHRIMSRLDSQCRKVLRQGCKNR